MPPQAHRCRYGHGGIALRKGALPGDGLWQMPSNANLHFLLAEAYRRGDAKRTPGKGERRSLCELLENLPAILRITWWMDFSSSEQIRKRKQNNDYQDEREGRRRPAAPTRTKGAHQNETNR